MKILLSSFMLLIATSSQADFWPPDTIEKTIKRNGGVVFVSPGVGQSQILANTSCERINLTPEQQHEIQVKRMTNFCKSLGYQTPVLGTVTSYAHLNEFIDYGLGENGTGIQDYGCEVKREDGSVKYKTYAQYFNRIGCLNKNN